MGAVPSIKIERELAGSRGSKHVHDGTDYTRD
jgi:hypothetical protein